jgi:predicted nucleic acid-binding protein
LLPKKNGLLPQVQPALQRLQANDTGLGAELIDKVLRLAGEQIQPGI